MLIDSGVSVEERVEVGVAAAVDDRSSLLRREVRHALWIARTEFELSYRRAESRIKDRVLAHHEAVRLILDLRDVGEASEAESVLVFGDEHDGPIELVFSVEPMSRSAEPSHKVRRPQPALVWNPFE